MRSLGVAVALLLVLAAPAAAAPAWLHGAHIVVPGDLENQDCRTGVCKHNENTDLIEWNDAIWFVHRTAGSQILGPNSSLRVYRSRDHGRHFALQAIIPAPVDRDIRDPSFFVTGKRLRIKAITRLSGFALRDADAGSVSIETGSKDGRHWSALRPIGPEGWGFWRVKALGGVYYSAAYQDGDLQVVLYRSRDGVHWRAGPQVYGVAADTPLETELVFSPTGKRMLGLVRMDGDDFELLGNNDNLRTKVCWSRMPFRSFSCPQELRGVRLDGAVAWWWGKRLFVVARKHIEGPDYRKRTALYELRGNFEGGPLSIREWGELPSAGDTSYAGVAPLGGARFLVTWYSSPLAGDPSWLEGFQGQTDIWQAALDLSKLRSPDSHTAEALRHHTPA